MSTTYRPYAPDQTLLLPASLREWLPEGHLAYFISDTVDALDLETFHARYEGDGRRRQPFDPAMMVKVLVCVRQWHFLLTQDRTGHGTRRGAAGLGRRQLSALSRFEWTTIG